MKLVDEIERLMNEWFTTDRTRAVAMTALLKISGRSDIEKDEDEAEEIRTRVEDLIAKWEKSIKLSCSREVRCSSANENFNHFTVMFQLRHKNMMRVAHSYGKEVTQNPH